MRTVVWCDPRSVAGPSAEAGFSMIEVLVTILLICIGVLGLVALQGRTITYTQDSALRNAAAMLERATR